LAFGERLDAPFVVAAPFVSAERFVLAVNAKGLSETSLIQTRGNQVVSCASELARREAWTADVSAVTANTAHIRAGLTTRAAGKDEWLVLADEVTLDARPHEAAREAWGMDIIDTGCPYRAISQ